MASERARGALCGGCGLLAAAACPRCGTPTCARCAGIALGQGAGAGGGCRACVTPGTRAHVRARGRVHPNAFAHGLLTVLFATAALSFTFGLERDPAWMAYLLGFLVATLVVGLLAARDLPRYGDTFTFLVCLTSGMQVLRASQRGADGLLLLVAFVPFAIALRVAQRRDGWVRFLRYLLLMLVPALASRMLLAGQAPLAAAWVAVAVALVV